MVWDFWGDGAMWSGSHACFCLTVEEVTTYEGGFWWEIISQFDTEGGEEKVGSGYWLQSFSF